MKVILFGATGMIGQGVLRECLLDPTVEQVLSVGRNVTGKQHAKLRELAHKDLGDLAPIAAELRGYDACFFCAGVSSAGMKEPEYRKITYDLTLAAARVLAAENPAMTFIYVSGNGTDSSEKGRSMWARVKGETENALLKLPFKASYMFRPGYIQPQHGVKSRTRLYRVVYAVMWPLYPVMQRLFPGFVTSTDRVAKAMIRVARDGAETRVLENRVIDKLGKTAMVAS